jgi:4-amino-4-deoxy-L-arabinose transferase-like glycosyltransferase
MILLLHAWGRLGASEFFLRLPFILAGILFSWIMFLWVRQISHQVAAFYTLALLLYLPSLISLSSEIRQYPLLLFFAASSLYALERAFQKNSPYWIVLSMAALYLAMLTHYSALIFAAALAVYGLVRLLGSERRPKLMEIWLAGQAGAAAIFLFLLHSQVSPLRRMGLPSEIAQTWLRSSIFQPGEDRLPSFAWAKTVRLFRYFLSHGTIGVCALVMFSCALVLLFAGQDRKLPKTSQRALALLWTSPFLLTLGAARAGIYPYGGTRHDVILALFAIPGVALALDWFGHRLEGRWRWSLPIMLAAALIIANLFPSPSGPYIRPRNQNRKLIAAAMGFLRSLPSDSVLLTDRQGILVLGYYLCGRTEPASKITGALAFSRCGDYRLISATNEETFNRASFGALLADVWRHAPEQTTLYLFQSGWIDDREEQWITHLRDLGGDPRNFGPNILVCPILQAK